MIHGEIIDPGRPVDPVTNEATEDARKYGVGFVYDTPEGRKRLDPRLVEVFVFDNGYVFEQDLQLRGQS